MIEQSLKDLTSEIAKLNALLQAGASKAQPVQQPMQQPVQQPMQQPVQQPMQQPVTVADGMPALPQFTAPAAPAVQPRQLPNNATELVAYAMEVYNKLPADKRPQMQAVLAKYGVASINLIPTAQYASFITAINALL